MNNLLQRSANTTVVYRRLRYGYVQYECSVFETLLVSNKEDSYTENHFLNYFSTVPSFRERSDSDEYGHVQKQHIQKKFGGCDDRLGSHGDGSRVWPVAVRRKRLLDRRSFGGLLAGDQPRRASAKLVAGEAGGRGGTPCPNRPAIGWVARLAEGNQLRCSCGSVDDGSLGGAARSPAGRRPVS
jgi:hypothetical protein